MEASWLLHLFTWAWISQISTSFVSGYGFCHLCQRLIVATSFSDHWPLGVPRKTAEVLPYTILYLKIFDVEFHFVSQTLVHIIKRALSGCYGETSSNVDIDAILI